MSSLNQNIFKDNLIELLLISLVFLDVFIQVLPTIPFCFFILLFMVFRLKYNEIIPVCLIVLPRFFGAIMHSVGLSGVGGFLWIIGLALFCVGLQKRTFSIQKIKFGMTLLTLLVIWFGLSLLFTTGGNYASSKFFNTLIQGFFSFLAFCALFFSFGNGNYPRIGLYFIIFSFLFLRITSFVFGVSGPSNIMDFGYMRNQIDVFNRMLGEENVYLNYQVPGMIALQGIAIIMLHSFKVYVKPLFIYLVFSLGIILSLYCGARQFVIISLLFVFLWLLIAPQKRSVFSLVFLWIVGAFFLLNLLNTLFSSGGMFASVQEEGILEASHRTENVDQGIDLFVANPLFGVGFGRYHIGNEYGLWPHNLILEVLAEMGFVGFFFIFVLVVISIRHRLVPIKYSLYLISVLVFRSLISGDLVTNISLFSMIFAMCCWENTKISNDEN